MSDLSTSPVGPLSPVAGAAAVARVVRVADPRVPRRDPAGQRDVAAVTGGSLKRVYAQLVVNPDTHDVVIRVRDATTHEVLSEYPAEAVEHMEQDLMRYLATVQHRKSVRR